MNELKILKGDPIEVVECLSVYPLTLAEISDIGDKEYDIHLTAIATNKEILSQLELDKDIPRNELNELYTYSDLEFIFYLSVHNPSILDSFMAALRIFLKSKVEFSKRGILIENDLICVFLDSDLFSKIKSIIFKQNFLKDSEHTSFKPANSKAKELMERLKKAKEKIQKQNDKEGLSLKDIISIVATYSNDINIKTVWDLTVSQLYESYLRLIIWDDYQNKQRLLPHTSDPQSLDIKHWATDINKLNNN